MFEEYDESGAVCVAVVDMKVAPRRLIDARCEVSGLRVSRGC
jgi:hypothetical protein